MTWVPPATVADFKTRFDRDFLFGGGLDSIRDADISNAIAASRSLYNSRLWADDDERKTVFLLLVAHYVYVLAQAAGGLSLTKGGLTSTSEGLVVSRSVGPVSETYDYPERVRNSLVLSQLLKSPYGQLYLQAVTPRLVGGMMIVPGWSEYGQDE